MHPTLSEVAVRAGVGTTTVSRVINGGLNVDPATLARVQHAIEALGYMPNHAARILKGGRTRTIGFVIPSIADPFFSSCAEAAQAVARANDSVFTVLTTQNDSKTELDAVRMLMRHRVDGILLAPCNSEDDVLVKMLSKVAMPVITIDRPIRGSGIPAVVTDNSRASKSATKHLLEHGFKRIVCVTRETHLYTIQERIKGYKEAMTEAGLVPQVDTSVEDVESATKSVEKWLSSPEPPEALFTLKNSTTIAVFEVLQKFGIAIPGQLALIGYDDFQLAEILRPSVTVIQQPIEQVGRVAAELLFQRLANFEQSSPDGLFDWENEQLKTKLVCRASCGCQV
jgi:LacI family transcriptional regulator